ncbi:MAG: Zn-dependent oligopeptidase [Bacteroidales bacterium]|nr:Zn-dependent oligopeptidase [Bacteroidales bacterium]
MKKVLNYFLTILLIGTGLISCNKNEISMKIPFFNDLNQTIDFKSITAQHVADATSEAINMAKENLNNIYAISSDEKTFKNTMRSLDNIYNDLMKVNEVVSLLAYVHPDDEIRNKCLESTAEFGKFFNEISLSEDLYKAVKTYSSSEEAAKLTGASKKYLKETVEEFERNGFALPKEKRDELKVIQDKLSDLGIQFDSNINSYQDFLIVTEDQIDGLPDDYKKAHRQEDGTYKIGMEYPSYIPFMKYSKSDEARKELAKKFKNTAADKNLDILKQILIEREKMAALLGYKTFAEYRTENRMAKNPQNVWDFENTLKEKVRTKAERDYEELLDVKRKYISDNSIKKIDSWEASFYNNILLKDKYELDNQKLKEYFELGNVIDGLFKIAQHLYGVKFEEVKNPSVWSDEVRFYEVKENDELIARFYLDLFPRENKFNHAACFGMISGKIVGDEYQIPTASLVCNFPKATDDVPALMTHNDVETFFHEFGHLMHDLLTKAELASQAGTNVARDFVEMPSQIFENWAWNYEALSLFAKHYKTGKVLPKELHEKMLAAKNVGSGLHVLQQIFYGILDMTFHDKFNPNGPKSTTELVKELQHEITLYKFQEGTHFEAGLGHLNGYAAGYYSYLWALVFADDMFSVFEKNGVMNQETGMKLRNTVLERGSTLEEMEIVKEFLGREPNEEAFLKSIGL